MVEEKITKVNYQLAEQFVRNNEFTNKELMHYLGAWYHAGVLPDIKEGDRRGREPNIYRTNDGTKLLYKTITIKNLTAYMKPFGYTSDTIQREQERKALEGIALKGGGQKITYPITETVAKGDQIVTNEYIITFVGAVAFTYEKKKKKKDGTIKHDKIHLAGWEGVIDNGWSAISSAIIPHLSKLSIYGLRFLFELQCDFRRNMFNPKRIKYSESSAIFVRDKDTMEELLWMDKSNLRPIQRLQAWVDLMHTLTCESGMVTWIYVPLVKPDDYELKKTLKSAFFRKYNEVVEYCTEAEKRNKKLKEIHGMLDSTHDSENTIILDIPWSRWSGLSQATVDGLERETIKWLDNFRKK